MVHAFLLIGQSNAAGRGNIANAPRLNTCDGRLKVLRNGRWQTMFRPLNPDRGSSGVTFAESFARCYAKANPQLQVGIIPCADGGTSMSQWMPGEALFDYAVFCAKLAMRSAHLVGVLWHQGESDCADEDCAVYYDKLKTMMTQLRLELGKPELPILVGGLGDFLPGCTRFPEVANYQGINSQLQRFAADDDRCEFVDATGLEGKPDCLHFSAAAQEEFGKRYYEAFLKFGDVEPPTEESDISSDTKRSDMEQL